MVKILLIWWLALTGTPDRFYCNEYDLVVDRHIARSNEICYTSPFEKSLKKYFLTIKTDSLELKLAILRTFPLTSRKDSDPYHGRGSLTGSQSFAVVVGQPNQLYVVREEIRYIDFKRHYWLNVIPIRQNERSNKPIRGRAIVISNQKICEL